MSLIDEYEKQFPTYDLFGKKIEGLLADFVRAKNINVLSVTSRCKSKDSFVRKIHSDPKYLSIEDMTDFSGVRVVTYFEDDVQRVAEIVEREFSVDAANSIDKKTIMEPDRFGYLSLHYVVSLTPERATLSEYKIFRGCKVEIQIRSALQHAWAEIEHDLGYKREGEIPRLIRRRFSRIAGLLELADYEFIGIRNHLRTYAETVKTEIKRDANAVEINKDSIAALLRHDPKAHALEREILTIAKAKPLRGRLVPVLVTVCEHLRINSIGVLRKLLNDNRHRITAFTRGRLPDGHHPSLPMGVSVLFLGYILAADNNGAKGIRDLFEKTNIGSKTSRKSVSEQMYKLISRGLVSKGAPPTRASRGRSIPESPSRRRAASSRRQAR